MSMSCYKQPQVLRVLLNARSTCLSSLRKVGLKPYRKASSPFNPTSVAVPQLGPLNRLRSKPSRPLSDVSYRKHVCKLYHTQNLSTYLYIFTYCSYTIWLSQVLSLLLAQSSQAATVDVPDDVVWDFVHSALPARVSSVSDEIGYLRRLLT